METHPGWRGVGRAVPADAADPLAAAGLDWTVRKVPAEHNGPTRWCWLERSDTKRAVGVVLPSYPPHQNRTAFRWAVGKDTQLVFAAELDGGSRVIVGVAVGEPLQVPGDPEPLQVHIVASNRHDSKGSFEAYPVVVRGGSSPLIIKLDTVPFRALHRSNSGIPPRTVLLQLAREYGRRIEALANRLITVPVSGQQVDEMIDAIKPPRKRRSDAKDMAVLAETQALKQVDGTRSDLKQGWLVEPSLAPVRHTAWGALLSVVHHDNYLRQSHARKDSTLSREERVLLRILFEAPELVLKAVQYLDAPAEVRAA